ncbi:hypothetical protein L9F63_025542, partial [Diploptera punctata]
FTVVLEYHLKPTWDWLLTVMDSTEAQLRFGASLTHSSDPTHPGHPLHQTAGLGLGVGGGGSGTSGNSSGAGGTRSSGHRAVSSNSTATTTSTRIVGFATGVRLQHLNIAADPQSARRDFLSYCLSLMRAHNAEHLDSLPILDVSALKHIAYVFDALIYYMRSGTENTESDVIRDGIQMDGWNDQDENDNDEGEDELNQSQHSVAMEIDSMDDQDAVNHSTSGINASTSGQNQGRKNPFLQRSDSTLCLGCPPPDPFDTPMSEALPLADQPHLLQPNARREELFGMPKQPITVPPSGPSPAGTYNPLEVLPTRLGLSMRTADNANTTPCMTATNSTHLGPVPNASSGVVEGRHGPAVSTTVPTTESTSSKSQSQPGPSRPTEESNVNKEQLPFHRTSFDGFDHLFREMDENAMKMNDANSEVNVNSGPVVPTSEEAETSLSEENRKLMEQNRAPIIVSPRKVAAGLVNFINCTADADPSGTSSTATQSAAATAPVKSVIVRAGPGPATSNVLVVPTTDPRQHGEGHGVDNVSGNHEISAHVTVETSRAHDQPRTHPTIGSIVSELGGFPVKRPSFAVKWKKLRNAQQRDLTLAKVERERTQLIVQTMKELNTQYNNFHRRASTSQPPLAVNRVKVTFKDEPGEGSGVARSFYTAIAEALLANEKLPNLEAAQVGA